MLGQFTEMKDKGPNKGFTLVGRAVLISSVGTGLAETSARLASIPNRAFACILRTERSNEEKRMKYRKEGLLRKVYEGMDKLCESTEQRFYILMDAFTTAPTRMSLSVLALSVKASSMAIGSGVARKVLNVEIVSRGEERIRAARACGFRKAGRDGNCIASEIRWSAIRRQWQLSGEPMSTRGIIQPKAIRLDPSRCCM